MQRALKLQFMTCMHIDTAAGTIQKALGDRVPHMMPAEMPELTANMRLSNLQKETIINASRDFCHYVANIRAERQGILGQLREACSFVSFPHLFCLCHGRLTDASKMAKMRLKLAMLTFSKLI